MKKLDVKSKIQQCVGKLPYIKKIPFIKTSKATADEKPPKCEYHFQKLTPIHDADVRVYGQAIDFVFANKDITNIAISGPYSSGKSSLLETYKATHPDYSFLHLSLAHFEELDDGQLLTSTPDKPKKQDGENNAEESVLEGKILNQLIHQIPADAIPQTNFKIKRNTHNLSIFQNVVLLCALIFSTAYLLNFSDIVSLVNKIPNSKFKIILSVITSPYAELVAGLILMLCVIIVIAVIVKIQKNRNIFNKISFQGNEIEIFEEQDESYFDKYLNEVLYLFENVDVDAIVFEDMDRFNANKIFERLREINNLVNLQISKKRKKPLRFFYLLRDDIFTSKDRTKFFDFIIPVIPVVDGSNSYEQLIELLKENKIFDNFDEGFLQSLSLYIDDMRLLKNICNELYIYIERLNTTELDWNKMLAIITYKNIFPRDFSNLQLARGYVHELFRAKRCMAETATEELSQKLSDLKSHIEEVDKEVATSLQDLQDIMDGRYRRNRSYEQDYKNRREFEKRKPVVLEKANIENSKKEYKDIEHKIATIKSAPMKELIKEFDDDKVFDVTYRNDMAGLEDSFIGVKKSNYFDLLKFLIRNGYIDETYPDYMTYFYPNSMCAGDKTFLRRITDHRGAEYEYRLKEPERIISSPMINAVVFEQEEILNFDLFKYLLMNWQMKPENEYLKLFIQQLKTQRNLRFVSLFYALNCVHDRLVAILNCQWSSFFSAALHDENWTDEQIRQYSLETFEFTKSEVLDKVDQDGSLSQYVSNIDNYLQVQFPVDEDCVIKGFSTVGILFKRIDVHGCNRKLFDGVYQNSLYVLSFENIQLMLMEQYGIKDKDDIVHKNYTLISEHKDSSLYSYVHSNIDEYVKVVLTNCASSIKDEENMAIALVNNDSVDPARIKQYLSFLSTTISKISEIKNCDFWSCILNTIVEFSISNLMDYYQQFKLDDNLVKYINDSSQDADFTDVAEMYGGDTAKNLFSNVAACKKIQTQKYRKILHDLHYIYNDFAIADLPGDKIEVLIEESIVVMNNQNLEFIRKNYPTHVIDFIGQNLDTYLDIVGRNTFSLDEALEIITWEIPLDKKTRLLALTNQTIPVIGKNYSDDLNDYLIRHHFDSSELQHLCETYSSFDDLAKQAIYTRAVAAVPIIIQRRWAIDDSLLSLLFKSGNISDNQKISLFDASLEFMTEDVCKGHFDELGVSELKNVFQGRGGSGRNYEINSMTTGILTALQKHNWIYRFAKDERNPMRYRVTKNKP